MRGLESRYSAGLSMLRILSTRSLGRRRISSSGIIGFHGLHEGLTKETRPSPHPQTSTWLSIGKDSLRME